MKIEINEMVPTLSHSNSSVYEIDIVKAIPCIKLDDLVTTVLLIAVAQAVVRPLDARRRNVKATVGNIGTNPPENSL